MNYVGVNNIKVSQIEDTIFITDTTNIGLGTQGSFAVYDNDNDNVISSTGNFCVWNKNKNVLEVKNITTDIVKLRELQSFSINSKLIESENLTTENLKTKFIHSQQLDIKNVFVTDYFHAPKVSVSNWIAFKSKKDESHHCFRLKLKTDKTGIELLSLTAFLNKDLPETEIIKVEESRTSILNTLNLKSKTIKSSVGVAGDKKGDTTIDNNYIFHCIKDFDGVSKIWKRVELSSW